MYPLGSRSPIPEAFGSHQGVPSIDSGYLLTRGPSIALSQQADRYVLEDGSERAERGEKGFPVWTTKIPEFGNGSSNAVGRRIYQARSEGRKRDLLSTLQGSSRRDQEGVCPSTVFLFPLKDRLLNVCI